MAETPTRIGIIGLGRSGWNIHANALANHDRFAVTAVADPMVERQEEAKERFGAAPYGEPEGVIGDENVDVIVVATPSHTHVPLTIAALGAGKHVVVEKPMADTAAEVGDMIAAADAANRFVTCYQPRRLDPEFETIQSLISTGRLGDIVLIRRTAGRFQRRADWQMLRKFGGGELSNTVPHLLDQVLLLLNDGPLELFADLRHTVGAGDAEDHVKLVLRGDSGPVADIESTLCFPIGQEPWLVEGTQGAVIGSERKLRVRWYDPSKLGELTLDEGAAAGRKYGTGEVIDWQEETLDFSGEKRSQALKFYDKLDATLTGGADLFVTPQSSQRQIELIERARKQTGYL